MGRKVQLANCSGPIVSVNTNFGVWTNGRFSGDTSYQLQNRLDPVFYTVRYLSFLIDHMFLFMVQLFRTLPEMAPAFPQSKANASPLSEKKRYLTA